MIRLDDEPAKRLRDWLEDDEADQEDDDRDEADQDGTDQDEPEDDEETTSEFVQRIVREYSRLGHRTGGSERDQTDRSEREE